MEPTNLLLSLLMFIPYKLALTYIGITIKLKNMIIPSLLISTTAYVTKIYFNAPPIIYTIIITVICAIIMYAINNVKLLLSIIGSLLSITTFVLGSLLIACPFFIKIGFEIPNKPTGMQWIFLTLLEFLLPTLVLIILKVRKFSPIKILL